MFDALLRPGLQWYWKADFVKEINDEAIALHVEHAAKTADRCSRRCTCIRSTGRRTASGRTTTRLELPRRELGRGDRRGGPGSGQGQRDQPAGRKDYWDALHPHSAGGAYVNFMMDEGDDRVRATYRDNYARLAKIKKRYDPSNLFRVNQNIKPK